MRSLLLSLALFSFSSILAAQTDPILAIPITDQFLNDPVIRGFFADLLEKGGSGFLQTERGAFLVREESGEYRCVLWPRSINYREQQFDGAIPPGTVAIIHTHPKEIPLASVGDLHTAMRRSVPIFVLTPRNIYMVTARGENVPVVVNSWWAPPVSASSSRRCSAPNARASRWPAD